MFFKSFLFVCVVATSLLFARETVRVAAAANVSFVMPALIKAYKKHRKNTKITVTFASSGKLAAQILHGAPYDIFLSANSAYADAVCAKQKCLRAPEIYAKGILVLFSARTLQTKSGLDILRLKNIRRIAIANPQTAPYGKAAIEALQNASLLDAVRKKIVYAESVAQASAYVMHGVDAGFVAKSSLFTASMLQYKEGENWFEVDARLYTPITQSAALLRNARSNEEARMFYEFLFTQEAKRILKRFGYAL